MAAMTRRMLRNRGFATVTTASGLLISVNIRRWALVISAPLANHITIDFGGAAVLDQGLNIYPGTLPLILTSEHIGEALREDVFVIGSAGSQTIGWLEVFWP